MSELKKPIHVWMHKETAQLYEHMPTCLGGYGLASVDIDAKQVPFTDWHDWEERRIFCFDDSPFYNPKNFIDLGEL